MWLFASMWHFLVQIAMLFTSESSHFDTQHPFARILRLVVEMMVWSPGSIRSGAMETPWNLPWTINMVPGQAFSCEHQWRRFALFSRSRCRFVGRLFFWWINVNSLRLCLLDLLWARSTSSPVFRICIEKGSLDLISRKLDSKQVKNDLINTNSWIFLAQFQSPYTWHGLFLEVGVSRSN